MRLWIDGQCLQTLSRFRGIGRYVTELIRAIGETCPEVEMSISFNAAMPQTAIAARGQVERWIAGHNIHLWQGTAAVPELRSGHDRARRLGEIALAHHVACLAPDIALSASPFEGQHDCASPLLTRAGHDFPWAAIFYDAIPYRYPRRYLSQGKVAAAYRRRLRIFREFDVSLAISGFAHREALDILPGINVAQIDAGVSPDFIALADGPADPAIPAAMGLASPFLLYVGALDWRKNLVGVVEGFGLLPQALRQQLQFALAGDANARDIESVRAAWARAGLPPDNLRLLGHVSDAVLVQLYKQAALVIQPSLMEGFGLTALEAMHCGAPVIAADAGALPEVVGNADALFDPTRPASIAARIAAVFSDTSVGAALVESGLARAGEFSWARTARRAVTALALVARKQPVVSDIEALRHTTRDALGRCRPEPAARILAAAEPPPQSPGRLLIDVSCIADLDHGTGIQRVVNNIARGLLRGTAPRRELFWCDSDAGLFRAGLGTRLTRLAATPAHHIIPRRDDCIVMLDSSWGYAPVHARVLQRARLQGSQVITVLYDLVPLKMPAFCEPHMTPAFTAWITAALEYSTGFICISRAVADEFLALLEAIRFPNPMKVGYWRLGADFSGSAGSADKTQPPADPPDFLLVGTLEPRKGHRVALDVFSQLWAEGFAGHLTIIGKRGWAVDHLVADMKSHPEWGRKLHWLEGPGDEILRARYAACTALVIPSHGEGFGLPIVEAAYHRKPVIASDLPVFREVAGGTADVVYFPAGSVEALAETVRNFSARAHAAPAPLQAAAVTWAQSAEQFENVVLADNWYRSYQPDTHSVSNSGLDGKPRYRLALMEKPIPAGRNNADRIFVVRLDNLGASVWSGADIALGCRLLDGQGNVLQGKTPRAAIALVQIPGDAHFMSITLGAAELQHARTVEIALFAGDEGLWESALRVAL